MGIWQTLGEMAGSAVRASSGLSLLRMLGLEGSADRRAGVGIAFTIAIVALSAKMAKSDGYVSADEIEAFRRVCQFEPGEVENVRRVFDLAKQDVAGYEAYARQLARILENEPTLKRDVLEGLFAIAAADGVLHTKEERYLGDVANHLGVPPTEVAWVRSLFVADASDPYGVLGLSPQATAAEIKARYRALAFEHHPDRLVGRGVPPEFVALAERTLASINGAYEAIARERKL